MREKALKTVETLEPEPDDNNGPRARQTKITEVVIAFAVFGAALTTAVLINLLTLCFLGVIVFSLLLINRMEEEHAFERVPQTDLILLTILKVAILAFCLLLFIFTVNPWTLFFLLLMGIPYGLHMAKAGVLPET